jgi:hypothetical protein
MNVMPKRQGVQEIAGPKEEIERAASPKAAALSDERRATTQGARHLQDASESGSSPRLNPSLPGVAVPSHECREPAGDLHSHNALPRDGRMTERGASAIDHEVCCLAGCRDLLLCDFQSCGCPGGRCDRAPEGSVQVDVTDITDSPRPDSNAIGGDASRDAVSDPVTLCDREWASVRQIWHPPHGFRSCRGPVPRLRS